MTRAAKAKYYTAVYLELVEAIESDKTRVVEMVFDTAKEAQAFRLEFYSFRACAEREGMGSLYEELSAITILTDRDSGTKLRIMHKDNTPNANALRKALERK